jgi:cobalt/nickel transport system ATP-binding protein
VIATHDTDMACRLADRVNIVRGGSIVADGAPRDIFYDRDRLQEAGLAQPEVVEIYLDYCRRLGLVPTERPLTSAELLDALVR